MYSRVKAAAKRKFKVYPSAYANAWLVREYKKRGYRKGINGLEVVDLENGSVKTGLILVLRKRWRLQKMW